MGICPLTHLNNKLAANCQSTLDISYTVGSRLTGTTKSTKIWKTRFNISISITYPRTDIQDKGTWKCARKIFHSFPDYLPLGRRGWHSPNVIRKRRHLITLVRLVIMNVVKCSLLRGPSKGPWVLVLCNPQTNVFFLSLELKKNVSLGSLESQPYASCSCSTVTSMFHVVLMPGLRCEEKYHKLLIIAFKALIHSAIACTGFNAIERQIAPGVLHCKCSLHWNLAATKSFDTC